MKIIRRILCVIAVLFAMLCVFIIVCAFRPDITERIAVMLYDGREDGTAAETVSDSGTAAETVSDLENGAETRIVVSQPADTEMPDHEEDSAGAAYEGAESGRETGGAEEATEGKNADYIAPDQSDIVIPEHVAGRSGYMQVQDDAQQVDDSVAGDIRSRLDAGYTGDGLDFDPVYYPYYAMLDDKGKHIYRQIYSNANAVYPAFVPVEEVTSGQLRNIFAAVYNDHPELFWLETAYACKYMRAGQCVEIDLEFNRTAQELDSAKEEFNNQVSMIVAEAQNLPDQYTKEKYVHDVLLEQISYNARAEMNQSAYSALVNGETVCAGYARAFQYILQQLGIPCYYCTGFAGESHAWNIVALDDGYYNVDTTWDDTDGGNYDYFNKTDEDYARSHIRQELSIYLPPCNGQVYRTPEEIQSAGDNGLRGLEETGLTQEQVFTDMGGYYANCYDQVISNGMGHYTFSNAIKGEQLFEEWQRSYDSEDYRQAYMENAMTAIGAYHCTMALEVEELQDGIYLVTHDVRLTE